MYVRDEIEEPLKKVSFKRMGSQARPSRKGPAGHHRRQRPARHHIDTVDTPQRPGHGRSSLKVHGTHAFDGHDLRHNLAFRH